MASVSMTNNGCYVVDFSRKVYKLLVKNSFEIRNLTHAVEGLRQSIAAQMTQTRAPVGDAVGVQAAGGNDKVSFSFPLQADDIEGHVKFEDSIKDADTFETLVWTPS